MISSHDGDFVLFPMEEIERKCSLYSSLMGQILPFTTDSLEELFPFQNSLLVLSCNLLDDCQIWGNFTSFFRDKIRKSFPQTSFWLCIFETFLFPEYTWTLHLGHLIGILSEPPSTQEKGNLYLQGYILLRLPFWPLTQGKVSAVKETMQSKPMPPTPCFCCRHTGP